MKSPLTSPLAKKLAATASLDLALLRGTGPRGRIMAQDVRREIESPSTKNTSREGVSAVAADLIPTTRPEKAGYFVYDCEVDMRALASISRPIAVQCDKLLESRYSLMDYIVRAAAKSCSAAACMQEKRLDIVLFESDGQTIDSICDAADMSIYQIARHMQQPPVTPDDFSPKLVICDANTTREQVANMIGMEQRPDFAMVIRGRCPKVGIRVGADLSSMILPYTFYVSTRLSSQDASRVAARLRALLYDPVSLLLIK